MNRHNSAHWQRREAIEQAIARGWPVVDIMRRLTVSYAQYRLVLDLMEEAVNS